MTRLLAVGLLLFGACQCGNIGVQGRTYACSTSDDCVEGFTCINGACVANGSSDGGSEQDGSVVDAGALDGGPDAGKQQADGGGLDAGNDSGSPDAGAPDSGSVDAGPIDLFGDGGCVQAVSMAIDPVSGHPAVAFMQGTHVQFAECVSGCTSTPAWTNPEIVQANAVATCGDPTLDVSLAFLPNGNPAIVYQNAAEAMCPLVYAVRSMGVWNLSTVSLTGCPLHRASSMAFVGDGGIVGLAYHDTGSTLQYAVCNSGCDLGAVTTWTVQTILTGNAIGEFTRIAADPVTLRPRIVFSSSAPTSVGFATCSQAPDGGECGAGEGAWTIGAIDTAAAPFHVSLAYPPGGGGAVAAYVSGATAGLVMAQCTSKCDLASSAKWTLTPVDSTLSAATEEKTFVQVQVDALGDTRIGYFDATKLILKYAVLNSTTSSIKTVDPNVLDGHLSFVLAPPGTLFAYSTGATLRYFPSSY
jgi:hypothetical protein